VLKRVVEEQSSVIQEKKSCDPNHEPNHFE